MQNDSVLPPFVASLPAHLPSFLTHSFNLLRVPSFIPSLIPSQIPSIILSPTFSLSLSLSLSLLPQLQDYPTFSTKSGEQHIKKPVDIDRGKGSHLENNYLNYIQIAPQFNLKKCRGDINLPLRGLILNQTFD